MKPFIYRIDDTPESVEASQNWKHMFDGVCDGRQLYLPMEGGGVGGGGGGIKWECKEEKKELIRIPKVLHRHFAQG